jgi:cobalt-zinc-cadmium efflux system outer membrane protein
MYKLFIPVGLAVSLACPVYAQSSAYLTNDAAAVAHLETFRLSEPPSVLTLAAAIALALEKNVDISAAQNALYASVAGVRQAGARPNPEIAALVEDARKDTRTSTFQVNQLIELGGKREARVNAANRAQDGAFAELRIKRAELRTAVTVAFFAVVIAQERQRLSQDSVDLAKIGTTMTSRRVLAGKAPPLEETKAKVVESTARLELNQAISELSNARKRLSGIWGNATPQFTTADGKINQLPALPEIGGLMGRMNSAPSLRLARIEVERQKALADIESSKRIPDVTVSLGTKRDEEARRNMWVVGLSAPIPVFDSNKANVLAALRRTDKARDDLAASEIRLNIEVSETYERLRNNRQEVDVLRRDILPGAQSAYDVASRGFQLGKFSFLEVLDVQRLLFQTKAQYLRALAETHRAAAELDRMVGFDDIPDSEKN